jgi:hypothetical protein
VRSTSGLSFHRVNSRPTQNRPVGTAIHGDYFWIAAVQPGTTATHAALLDDRGKILPGWGADLLLVHGDPTSDVLSSRDIVFSPDGRWIAYRVRIGNARLDSNNSVYVQPFPPTRARYQAPRVMVDDRILPELDFHPVWTPDGDSLVYVPSANSGRLAIVRVMKDRGSRLESR